MVRARTGAAGPRRSPSGNEPPRFPRSRTSPGFEGTLICPRLDPRNILHVPVKIPKLVPVQLVRGT